MDERTFWGWGTHAVTSGVLMLERLAEEARPIHPEQLADLKQMAERLVEVIGKAEKRQSETT